LARATVSDHARNDKRTAAPPGAGSFSAIAPQLCMPTWVWWARVCWPAVSLAMVTGDMCSVQRENAALRQNPKPCPQSRGWVKAQANH